MLQQMPSRALQAVLKPPSAGAPECCAADLCPSMSPQDDHHQQQHLLHWRATHHQQRRLLHAQLGSLHVGQTQGIRHLCDSRLQLLTRETHQHRVTGHE